MRGKKLLLWSVLAALLLTAGAALWAWNTDLGRFKPQLESFVSARLGREFRLAELHLHLGEEVAISARGVRLANPQWADAEDLLTVGSVEATVRFAALFRSPLLVERLRITDVDVHAEHSEEHGSSASFPDRGQPDEADAPAAALPLWVRHLRLEDVALHFERPGELPPLEFRIESLTQEHLPDDMLQLAATGSLNGEPIHYDGSIGPVAGILADRDVHFDGTGQVGPLSIEGRALMDSLTRPHHPSLDLTLTAPDIARVADMLRLPAPPPAPLRLTAEGEADGDRLALKVHATVGETRIRLDGHSAGLLDLSRVEYAMEASGPNLGALTKFLQLGAWPEQPFTASGSVMRDGRVLTLDSIDVEIGSTSFDLDAQLEQFPDLANARIDFDLRGDDAAAFRELVGIEGVAVGPFEARGSLQAQEGAQDRLSLFLRTEVGEAQVEGTLGPGPAYAGSVFDLRLDGSNAQRVFDGYGVPGFLPEPFSADVRFTVRENGLDFERAAVATLGEDRLELRGFVSFTPLEAGTRVQLRATGDDLSQFVFLSGTDLPVAARSYEFEAGLRMSEDGFRIDGLTGHIDGNDVRIDGLVTRGDGFAGTDLAFSAEGQNLETLLTDTPSWDVPAEPFATSGHLRLFDGLLRLEDVSLAIGELQATGRFELPLPVTAPEFRLNADISGPDVRVIMPKLEGLALAPNRFALDLDVAVQDGAWRFDDTQLRVGDASLLVDGRARLAPEVTASDLSFQLQAPSLTGIGTWRGFPHADLPLSLDGRVSGTAGQATVQPLRLRLGGTDLTGVVTYRTAGPVPEVSVETNSNRIDWLELHAFLGLTAEARSAPGAGDGRLIPDFYFPLEQMKRLDLDVRAAAKEVRALVTKPRDLKLVARLDAGALRIETLEASGYRGDIRASGSLVPEPDQASAALDLTLELDRVVLNLAGRDGAVPPEQLPVLDVSTHVSGRGPGLREVAASLNGALRADTGPGTVPASVLSFFDAGILEQLFSAVLPADRLRSDTNLRCVVTRLTVEDGIVQADPGALIVTDRVQMVSKGRIDLRNERISLDFETHPTKAYQANISEVLVNPFVKISGTLAEPRITLDASKAALNTGAAIATAGWSILAKGLLDRLSRSKDPCKEFAKGGGGGP